MRRAACLPVLLLAAGAAAAVAPRLGSRFSLWLARARSRMWRVATVVGAGGSAVALTLSLVGVNGGAVDLSPTIQLGLAASIAIAALLIHGARGSGTEER